MTKTIVVGLSVTTTGATFYTKDGNVISRSAADDPRVTEFIQKVVTGLKTKSEVEVDLTSYTTFNVLEEKSGGLLKFFRVAKSALKSIFGVEDTYGKVNTDGSITSPKSGDAPQPGTEQVTEEVMAKLISESKKTVPKADTTVVAVVAGTPIVGAEKLEKQINYAVATKNTVGMTKFLESLGKVASERKHTAQELLHFLEKMDMPIADDGSILAYKSLTATSTPGVFTDNHSKRLLQGLGTEVSMDVELVDDNRRVLCSNGLHIARMKYLGSYGNSSENVICLVKIKPKHVIAVPLAEQDKMRVAAYRIVAVLNDTSKAALSAGVPITTENAENKAMLGRVMAGNHVAVLNRTTQHKGRAIDQMVPVAGTVTLAPTVTEAPANPAMETKPATSISDTVDTSKLMKEAKVDPASLNKSIDKAAGVKPSAKKDVKKVVAQKPKPKAKPKAKAKAPVKAKPIDNSNQKVQKPSQPTPKKAVVSEASPKAQPHEKVPSPVATTPASETKGQTAMRLYKTFAANNTQQNLQALLDFKSKVKKGWPALGFNPEQVKAILDASK